MTTAATIREENRDRWRGLAAEQRTGGGEIHALHWWRFIYGFFPVNNPNTIGVINDDIWWDREFGYGDYQSWKGTPSQIASQQAAMKKVRDDSINILRRFTVDLRKMKNCKCAKELLR